MIIQMHLPADLARYSGALLHFKTGATVVTFMKTTVVLCTRLKHVSTDRICWLTATTVGPGKLSSHTANSSQIPLKLMNHGEKTSSK